MPGHGVRAECHCGFERELRPGSICSRNLEFVGYSIAYNEEGSDLLTERDTVIAERQLKSIPDPFIMTHDPTPESYFRESERISKPQGPYLCPSCKQVSLMLKLETLWD